MLMRVAQIKCYNCGRTCGEVVGPSIRDLTLENARVPEYIGESGRPDGIPSRCQRCEGSVYVDEPFTLSVGEILAPRESLPTTSPRKQRSDSPASPVWTSEAVRLAS